ncbi:MAG: DUF4175 family protein [Pseudomonadota bacterium]
MHTEDNNHRRNLIKRLGILRALARVVMVFEAFLSAFWQPIVWVLLFVGLWLLDIPSILGSYGREISLLLFVGGLVALIYRNIDQFHIPSSSKINRRLEEDNALKHRPISVLNDTLANPEKDSTLTLWQSGKQKALERLKKLQPSVPRAVVAPKDPYALRIGVIILCVGAFVIAGNTWQQRLQAGLFPFGFTLPGYGLDGATLTITPPDYTRQSITAIKGVNKDEPISIPQGSELKAQVHGGLGLPKLFVGEREEEFVKIDRSNYGAITTITDGDALKIKQFWITRLSWPYTFVPDTAPTLLQNGEYEVTEYATLRFNFTMRDDYGVRDLHMRMELDPVVEEAPLGEPVEDTRAVMSPPDQDLEINPTYDLTSHVWAGLPAIIRFTAEDDLGQISELETKIVLPEREFQHPVAKKLIEHRKTLAWDYAAPPEEIRDSLIDIINDAESYDYEIIVFLSLRTAVGRLQYSAGSEDTTKALIDLFWNVAIHLEDGDLNMARERLLQAQRELEQALSDPNTSDAEKAQLVEQLKQALAEYFRELGREMQKQMAESENAPLISPEMLSQMLQPEDLARFFDQLESEALSGDPDAARELLSQLSRLMDMLDPSMQMAMPMDMQMMSEGVSELQELVRRQEELLDQTRAQSDLMGQEFDYGDLLPNDPNSPFDFEGLPPAPQTTPQSTPNSQVDTSLNKVEQDALRYVLGQLMLEADRVLGEIPENMGLAEREMLGSSENLGTNRPDLAIPHQERAIEYLREAMQDLSQQMMARMEQLTGMTFGQAQTDPLGRRTGQGEDGNNWFSGSEVQIPDEAERKRVEEILKELRKKSGEFNRPDEELDYFRRLLKQF